jgi:hypothetical protein
MYSDYQSRNNWWIPEHFLAVVLTRLDFWFAYCEHSRKEIKGVRRGWERLGRGFELRV